MNKSPFNLGSLKFKLIVFFLFVVLCDTVIGKIFTYVFKNYPGNAFYNTVYSFDKSSEDIIVMGSSRAVTHYNPSIIEEIMQLSTWNTGKNGQHIVFWQLVEQEILKRYSPKIFIINVDPFFLQGEIENHYISYLRPFSMSHNNVKKALYQVGYFEKYKLVSSIYVYNSTFYSIVGGVLNQKDKIVVKAKKGYRPIVGFIPAHQQAKDLIEGNMNDTLNIQKIKILSEMIALARQASSKIYFIASPNFHPSNMTTLSFKYLNSICNSDDITFINLLNDTSLVMRSMYFFDRYHLNEKGADIFSVKVADTIKSLYFCKE